MMDEGLLVFSAYTRGPVEMLSKHMYVSIVELITPV
jgi:hypothetical protein